MLNLSTLRIIHYPDARLRVKCQPVTSFDAALADLAARMLELMREAQGIGLAAPQVGLPLRLFVMNAVGEPGHDLVVANPRLVELEGALEDEEGCLSIPEVRVQVRRATRCRLIAQDAAGQPLDVLGEDLVCRVWQHETDHLDGRLIIDRMGPGDELATRRLLRDLEARHAAARQ